ncbi:hypothetical protein AV656_14595 [Bhargavaea cecembensis]|uniref:N-acetyltransferase domain-containing protein n=1 Tax=Bhargavaea cecembensis TaxID=394098 RepID=A0A163EEY9_9BACL|nr:GNAT family N-acetyltransferase [Bhargavaea cecembensis]KZE36371.1 hypothetical protein AV656_14595 [Bhargavaea cecembensis]
MEIREYREEDRTSWVRCRVLSFMDSSYFDDVQNYREEYENPVIQIVAVDQDQVVGFLDCEYEEQPGDVCYFEGSIGGVIWHLGVLPEYREHGLATKMWNMAKEMLKDNHVHRVEVWTQDDPEATRWYLKKGFVFKEAYLNAFLKGNPGDPILKKFLNQSDCGELYGIRNLNFEAPIERKEELAKICYRLHEVRIYEAEI